MKTGANADAGGNAKADPRAELGPVQRHASPRTCGRCRHAIGGGAVMEQQIRGLRTLGSGFGSSIGASRLCQLHDQLVDPGDACLEFSQNLDFEQ
ncbi:hypothetical protein [Burkholderia sp. L27(2015)]|uniref:hypothetical protein n=1 Tax=Burkholderia sp. L27(2015) TaxID=1641858 RepID=UPI00131C93A6|nr:hypothetical protein [Burkholderia sp. L27(2015)]